MIIVEYRVPMPFSAAEYRIGQLYTIAKKSRIESADAKNGVCIHINEPYSNGPGGFGQYTNKTYYLGNRLPDWMKRLLPGSAAKLKEEAWNAYPYSKNKFTNSMVDKLSLEIESRYVDGPPKIANVFNLSAHEQRNRSIILIDLVKDKYKSKRLLNSPYTESEMLAFEPLYRSALSSNWLQEYELDTSTYESATTTNNNLGERGDSSDGSSSSNELKRQLMTCYKLCRISFPVWPLQGKVEQFIQQYCRDTIIETHRQAWLWQDEWTGMSLEEIRLLEKDTQSQLIELMRRSSFASSASAVMQSQGEQLEQLQSTT